MRIKIDDQEIQFSGSKTILEIARESGVYIPSLCDHPLLKPFGGCRLCLVEIKGVRGYVPACSQLAEDGMEVMTNSPVLEEMRRQTLELILSEHPNACLVCQEKEKCEEHKITIRKVDEVTGCIFCPKNNHCELQKVVQYLGLEKVRFPSSYRGFDIIRTDPFFDRNYNLCVLCGRCVRICHEVRGASAISFVFRGSKTVIGTAYNQPLLASGCQFCGACVDVCPVGALTERALRSELRAEREVTTVCPFCSQACLLKIKVKGERILGLEPANLESLGRMCVRGRFLIRDLVHNPYRLLKPFLRIDGELREASWPEALDYGASRLAAYSGEEIALVLSPHLSLEDLYALILLAQQGFKTNNLALSTANDSFVLIEKLFQENHVSWPLNYCSQDIAEAESIFVLGGDLAVLQPGLWVEVFQAIKQGAKLITLDSLGRPSDRFSTIKLQALPEAWSAILSRWLELAAQREGLDKEIILSTFKEKGAKALAKTSEAIDLDGFEQKIEEAFSLLAKNKSVFLIGPGFWPNNNTGILPLLLNLVQLLKARLILFGQESNNRGAAVLFKRLRFWPLSLLDIQKRIASGQIKAVLCFGPWPFSASVKPEFLFVVEPYRSPLGDSAQILLPAATVLERSGTFIGSNGMIKRFSRAIAPLGESQPDWWIASQLGGRLRPDFPVLAGEGDVLEKMIPLFPELKGLISADSSDLKEVLTSSLSEDMPKKELINLAFSEQSLEINRKGDWQILIEPSVDHYRSLPLALVSRDFRRVRLPKRIWLHPAEATKFKLAEGDRINLKNEKLSLEVRVKISSRIPPGVLLISLGSIYFPEYPADVFLSSCFSLSEDGSLIQEVITMERGS